MALGPTWLLRRLKAQIRRSRARLPKPYGGTLQSRHCRCQVSARPRPGISGGPGHRASLIPLRSAHRTSVTSLRIACDGATCMSACSCASYFSKAHSAEALLRCSRAARIRRPTALSWSGTSSSAAASEASNATSQSHRASDSRAMTIRACGRSCLRRVCSKTTQSSYQPGSSALRSSSRQEAASPLSPTWLRCRICYRTLKAASRCGRTLFAAPSRIMASSKVPAADPADSRPSTWARTG